MGHRGELHHVEVYVADVEHSAAFWGWLLAELGYTPHQEWDEGISWRIADTYIALVQAPRVDREFDRRLVGVNHLAFHVGSRGEVDELTDALRDRGARLLYEDRHPHAGGPDHYAAFFEDPNGIKVELVADG